MSTLSLCVTLCISLCISLPLSGSLSLYMYVCMYNSTYFSLIVKMPPSPSAITYAALRFFELGGGTPLSSIEWTLLYQRTDDDGTISVILSYFTGQQSSK